jgi:hypothetical protein
MGEYGRSFAAFSDSRTIAERLGWRRGMVMNDLFLVHLQLRREGWHGEHSAGLFERHHTLIEAARSLGDLETAVHGRLLLARGLREAGRVTDAAVELGRALADAERLDARVLVRDFRLEQASLASAQPVDGLHHLMDAMTEAAR